LKGGGNIVLTAVGGSQLTNSKLGAMEASEAKLPLTTTKAEQAAELLSTGKFKALDIPQVGSSRNYPHDFVGPIEQGATRKVAPSGRVAPAIDPAQRALITSHPNAHAFERHGGGVTDAQLETRARTGVAPDGSKKVVGGKTVVPPNSTAFHSDELLVKADQAIRNGPLKAQIAADPSATVQKVEGFDVGIDLGRGYSRIGGSKQPDLQGPLELRKGITKATAVYEKNAATGEWQTITIYPEP
jgi:hypothetical protein